MMPQLGSIAAQELSNMEKAVKRKKLDFNYGTLLAKSDFELWRQVIIEGHTAAYLSSISLVKKVFITFTNG